MPPTWLGTQANRIGAPLWQLFGMPPPLTPVSPPLTGNAPSPIQYPASTGDEPWRWIYGGWAAFFLSLLPGKVGYFALFHLVVSLIILFNSKNAKARWHAKVLLCVTVGILIIAVMIGFIVGANEA